MDKRILAIGAAAMMLFAAGSATGQTTPPKKKTPTKTTEPDTKKDAPPAEAKPAGSLKVGSDAPKLSGEKWVKGDEVKSFEKGKVYVVEFWATWCAPCKASIPHLTELQKEFKDAVFIGMASSEHMEKDGSDKREQKLEQFVNNQTTKMDYRVCYDPDSSMFRDWMAPAGQGGIPCAFVVGADGKLAYIGHPMQDEFKKSLEKAVADAKPKPVKKEEKPKSKKGGFLDRPFDGLINPAIAFDPPEDEKPLAKKDDTGKKEKAAKAEPLIAGAKAPELKIADWVKGEPVTGFEKGHVYVVEFWATWCPPCRESIPHLSEMNTSFKDKGVTFIGVSDEATTTVKPFVEKMGAKMNYTVAVDKSRATSRAWMEAAGQDGIPTAFVVDKEGRIAWIGHPMAGLDKIVGKVVDGTFDVTKEAQKAKKKTESSPEIKALNEKIGEAFEAQEWDKFLKLADELIELDPENAAPLQAGKFHVLLQKKDYPKAYELAGKLADGDLKDNAEALNEFAWTIVDDKGIEKRDYDLALHIAIRACEASKYENAMILDTLARCYYEKKDLAKAVEFQTKAVEKAKRDIKSELEATLKKYKSEQDKK